jgi:hypothetical protein
MLRLISIAAIAVLLIAPAQAQLPDPDYTTLTVTEAGVDLTFQPANCSPAADCPSFVLMCAQGAVELLARNLRITHVERWIVSDDNAVVVMGNAVLGFSSVVTADDPEWNWTARTTPVQEPSAFLAGMGFGGEIVIQTPFFVFRAPPSATDVSNLVEFGLVCQNAAAAAEPLPPASSGDHG